MEAGIDIGNTRTKIHLFEGDRLLTTLYDPDRVPWQRISAAALVRTGVMPAELKEILARADFPVIEVNRNLRLPFRSTYRSPSLGADRIALMAGAAVLYGGNTLVIDAGSCITYDYLDKELIHRGGAISPGLRMRYRALHDYTAALPLLEPPDEFPPLTGDSTDSSIHAGTARGTVYEIEGFIRDYQTEYPGVRTVITGGDAPLLSEWLKIKIFAFQKDLPAYGLLEILKLNRTRI
ncbi:MAG: type III pantothenate kinase [Chlorobi bacterium]|nr:type III pantothenate kinase [Chlorobiota bacterium]